MRKKRILLILLSLVLVLASFGCSQAPQSSTASGEASQTQTETQPQNNQQEPLVGKLAAHFAKGHPITDACYVFGDELSERTDGAIKVQVFESMQLGAGREIFENLQVGNAEFGESTLGPFAGFNKAFLALNLPYIFESREIAFTLLDGPTGQEMKDSIESTGVKLLEYWDNGYRQMTNSVRPIRTPEDLSGLKIRCMENEVHLEAFKQMGANPTTLAFGEVFTALQQGTIDGQENPYLNTYSMKFQEAQKYITDTNHLFDITGLMVSQLFWDKLSADQQAAVVDAARVATVFQRKREVEDDEKAKVEILKSLEFTELTPEERAKFKEKALATYDIFRDEIGSEKLDKILNEIEKIKKELN